MDLATGGLLRLPAFLNNVLSSLKQQQQFRDTANEPSLLNPDIQLRDLLISAVIAISLISIRLFMQHTIMPKLFPRRSPKLTAKLTEDLYYTTYYLFVFTYFIAIVMPNVTWSCNLWSNSSSVVKDLLYPNPTRMVDVERWYYIQAFGFYLSASVFLIFWDSKRSDYAQYIIHHIVTVGMISMSYLYAYVRVGMVVLALHDVGDIFLYSSKFFYHLKVKGIDIALFAAFVVTFYISRLVLYSRIVHAIMVECLQLMVNEPEFNQWAMFYDTYLVHYALFLVALIVLLVLHCFWFTLALRMVANELFYDKKISDHGDVRSDDEDEEDDEMKKNM